MGKDVISGAQRLKDGRGRACAGGECGGGHAALERADAAFQGVAVGIIVTRVHETARIRPFDVALERGGKINWGSNCSGGRINGMSGVNGESFNFHLWIGYRN